MADIEPWTFEQHLGEAVFIPAGCPHQVRNRQVVNPTPQSQLCFIKRRKNNFGILAIRCLYRLCYNRMLIL